MIIDGFLAAKLISAWLFGYSTLISIINPLGAAFVFHGIAGWLSPRERAKLARAIGLNSIIVILVALFLGARVLSFFGISLEALRIAGGLSVAVSGWRMLSEEPEARRASAPAAMDTTPIHRMAFFPLTLPLTTGPGTIAASIALGAERAAGVADVLLVSALSALLISVTVGLTVWLSYAYSSALANRMGPQGTLIATKLSAFLLLCIGAQIMLTGVMDALRILITSVA